MSYASSGRSAASCYDSSQPDINILMMSETGAGKSTFINAFTNYVIYSTLSEATRGDMQVLIPSTFHMIDPETFHARRISIEQPTTDEKCEETGQSSTQYCRSYNFRIGNCQLRLIDAPGIGDYDHLNGICTVLEPNNERLTVGFCFCFKEILTHLHINAKDNLMFVFNNGWSTFYWPGSTTPLVRSITKGLHKTWGVEIPFNNENTFMFDNEAFRFLATCKNGVEFSDEEVTNFSKSWEISVKEFTRLIQRIQKFELHAVRDSVSINSTQQLIRKLTRPIGETARLIEENIQLAKQHKQNILNMH
ncbi:unnamed protein product [Rotaria socialis]|uniref:G domain-containing protein n=1 Tax=Rotaria socialis TaxID=392032 RepID=A0A820K5H0_9BILA|nr:unnamed protein product [Rotaria socialis]CAF4338499.1 unnamed protein product [Rotaria socialis]